MNPKSCFFIGHQEVDERIKPRLQESVERLILEENVAYFYVGNYGSFDRLAAHVVINAKKRHPNITLMMLLPYHPEVRHVDLPEDFDGSYYPEGMENVPQRYAIVRANQFMVNTSDWLICYVWHTASNSQKLLEYARRREKRGLICVCQLETA